MAQDAFLSLVRDFPKKLCQSYGTKIDVQNSNGIKSARGFTGIFKHFDALFSR